MNPPLPTPEPLMLLLVAYLAWSLKLDQTVLRHPRQAILRIGSGTLFHAVSLQTQESNHESSLRCCLTMKLVYKQVFSPLCFLFPSFLTQQPVYLPCLSVLTSCFVSLFRFPFFISISYKYYSTYTSLFVPVQCCLSGLPSTWTH